MSVRSITALCVLASCAASVSAKGLPVASHFCLPDVEGCLTTPLMDWTPGSEQAHYYKRTTPLTKRLRLNQHVGDVVPQFGFDDSNTAAQIEFGHWVPQETNWQYLQQMVYFGGSQSGGQVLAPTPGWIHAAHQNGVKISGTIFFSPMVFGGDKELKAFADMVTPGSLQTQIAQQLVRIAKTYGFDGWFINQEVTSMSAEQKKGMQSFIHQLHLADPTLIVTWYDDSDTWTFLDNGINDLLIDPHSDKTIYNPVFINYGWSNPKQYVAAAEKIHYPISHIQYGVEVPGTAMGGWQAQRYYVDQVMPSADTAYGALVEWDYMTLITRTRDGKVTADQNLNALNANERDFWTNGQAAGEGGASQRVAAFTAVTQTPFLTTFNTGEGADYFIDGQSQQVGKWHDIGRQDLLPSWQFKSSSTQADTKVSIGYDYQHAYQGGSSLSVNVDQLSTGNAVIVPLYKTQLKIAKGDVLRLVLNNDKANARFAVCLKSADQSHCYNADMGGLMTWHNNDIDLSELAGKTVDEIDLQFKAVAPVFDLHASVGELYVGPVAVAKPKRPIAHTQHLCHSGVDCISWQADAKALRYRVFDEDNRFVGETRQALLTVPNPASVMHSYRVVAVAGDGVAAP